MCRARFSSRTLIKINFLLHLFKISRRKGGIAEAAKFPNGPLIPELFHVTEPDSMWTERRGAAYDLVGLSRFEGKKHPTLADNQPSVQNSRNLPAFDETLANSLPQSADPPLYSVFESIEDNAARE